MPLEEVKEFIDYAKEKGDEILCFIRHESTVSVLNKVFGLNLKPSNELYQYREGDVLVVVGLKKPIRGHEVHVTIADLDIAMVSVIREED